MIWSRPIADIIAERFSCRSLLDQPIAAELLRGLGDAAERLRTGPLGSALRFGLVAATSEDTRELKGLGTYGFVRNPAGFIIGAAKAGAKYLEDYGWAMEQLVLTATDLGLGSCWLGGFFTRSSFSRKVGLADGERLPAVVAIGMIPDPVRQRNTLLRRRLGAEQRLPWEKIFFDASLGIPLTSKTAGSFAAPLEAVRRGPSASNRQPWRIIRQGGEWHFYLQRTRGYKSPLGAWLKIEDIQRVDIGIAMCHFELAAREQGLRGRWIARDAAPGEPMPGLEYIVTWEG
jgi:hypothetical protein